MSKNNQVVRIKDITLIRLGPLEVRTNMIRKHVAKQLSQRKQVFPCDVLWAIKRKIKK